MFILDYAGRKTNLNLELTDDSIFNAWINVVTGDEILHVIRKDGAHEVYDSSDCRYIAYEDGSYDLVKAGKVLFSPSMLKKFNNRIDSYDILYGR